MSRPIIKIEKQPIDRFFEIVALIGLIILIIYPIMHYQDLPEKIPTHFNGSGEPDDYQKKAIIWILTIVGLFTYGLFTYIKKIPHKFNYTIKITEENAKTQYTIALRMINALNAIIMSTFAYISYSSIQIALKKATSLGSGFTPILLILVFGTIGYGLYQASKNA